MSSFSDFTFLIDKCIFVLLLLYIVCITDIYLQSISNIIVISLDGTFWQLSLCGYCNCAEMFTCVWINKNHQFSIRNLSVWFSVWNVFSLFCSKSRKPSKHLAYIVDILSWQKICNNSLWTYISVLSSLFWGNWSLCIIFVESSVDEKSEIWGKIAPEPPPNPAGIFMRVKVIPSAV